jgi:hypothetical protein
MFDERQVHMEFEIFFPLATDFLNSSGVHLFRSVDDRTLRSYKRAWRSTAAPTSRRRAF